VTTPRGKRKEGERREKGITEGGRRRKKRGLTTNYHKWN
jgi:hypothetical protein